MKNSKENKHHYDTWFWSQFSSAYEVIPCSGLSHEMESISWNNFTDT